MKQILHTRKLLGMRYFTSMLLLLSFTGFCIPLKALSVPTDKFDYSKSYRSLNGIIGFHAFNTTTDYCETIIEEITPSFADCGSTITISAKLIYHDPDFNIWYRCPNEILTFTLGSVVVTGTTNLMGEAYVSVTVPDPAGTLTVSYAGGSWEWEGFETEIYYASTASINFDNHAVLGSTGGISGDNNVCVDMTDINYSVPEVANATNYVWTVPAGATITWGQGTNSIRVAFGSNSGNITLTPGNNCYTGTSSTLFVTVNPKPPQPGLITGSAAVCHGSSQTYSIEPVPDASYYSWSFPSGWFFTVDPLSTVTATVGPYAVSGSVTVRAVNSGCSSFTRYFYAEVVDKPAQPTAIYGSATACQGTTQVYNVPPVPGATSYTWTLPEGWSGNSTSEIITAIAGTNGGTISVIANNMCGSGIQKTLNVSVTSPPAPPGAITGLTSACQGTTSVYSISPVDGASSYNWSVPSGWSIDDGQGTNSITVTTGGSGQDGNITVVPNYEWGSCQSSQVIDIHPDISENSTGYINSYNGTKVSGDLRCNSYNSRGYTQFPLSDIPSGATIRGATLYVTNKESDVSDVISHVTGLLSTDPVTANFSALFGAIYSGPKYHSSVWGSAGTISLSLNSFATSHIQNYLSSQGYISLGLIKGSESGYDDYYFYGYSGGLDAPKLSVIYESAIAGSGSSLEVTVSDLPEAPDAGDISAAYDGEIHIGTATPPDGMRVDWYNAVTGGDIIEAPSGTNAGIYTAWAESVDNTGCKSVSRAQVKVTISPEELVITASDMAKTYGQTVIFAGTEFISSGLQHGETIGSVTLTSSGAVPTANIVDSPYDIVATAAIDGTFDINNYSITYVEGALTVNPALLTIRADDATKYCGEPNPAFSVTYIGFVNGENESVLGGALSISSNADEDSGIGTYPITPSGLTSGNYEITFMPGVLTINGISIDASASSNPVPVGSPGITLSAKVLDADSNPLSDMKVWFSIENGNNQVTSYPEVFTDASGVAVLVLNGLTSTADVFKVTAVAGQGCGSAATSIAYLAVYDPNGGFVTGGGWINSPEGAYHDQTHFINR